MLTRRAILLMAAGLKVSPLAAQTVPDGAQPRAALLDTLRRLLETLVQEISLEESDGSHWLRLEKRVRLRKPGDR